MKRKGKRLYDSDSSDEKDIHAAHQLAATSSSSTATAASAPTIPDTSRDAELAAEMEAEDLRLIFGSGEDPADPDYEEPDTHSSSSSSGGSTDSKHSGGERSRTDSKSASAASKAANEKESSMLLATSHLSPVFCYHCQSHFFLLCVVSESRGMISRYTHLKSGIRQRPFEHQTVGRS